MKAAAVALTVGTMLTVEQRDAHRLGLDPPTSAVSADGRFVAFTSYSQLAPADADNLSDVYVLDRARRHVTLESADLGGLEGHSRHPRMSADGRFVVFECGDRIVLRDRDESVTTVIGSGHQPAIAQSGSAVAFTASRFDGAEADVNGQKTDIYLVNLAHGRSASRVSVDLAGLDRSLTASVNPSVSGDGRYVAFASKHQIPGTVGKTAQIYVRDAERQVTRFVAPGWDPSLSGDGRFVAFTALVKDLQHIFLADLQTGETRLITNNVRRSPANGRSAKPAMSYDGRFVAFQSEANDLVDAEDINLLWDVFVFDRITGDIARVSGDPQEGWMAPSVGPGIDATGSVIAFSSRHPTDASDKRNDFDLYVASAVPSVFRDAKQGGGR